MPYVGKSPSAVGVRSRYYFTASGGETSLSGSDNNGKTLVFTDAAYVDVILNGNNLVSGTDYVAVPNTNTISGLAALVANDVVEIISYDVFSVSDTVSASTGGTFSGSLTVSGNIAVTGTVDSRDVAADGTKLDGIEAAADVTDATNVAAAGALMTTGGSVTGNVTFGDSDKAIFGAGSDLQIYHDGSNSYIHDNGTGDLFIRGSSNVYIQNSGGGSSGAQFVAGGAANINYAGATKLATTATGVDVTGTVTAGNLQTTSAGRIFSGNGGNASNPMIANGSDQDTGIHFPAADTMALGTGGTNRLYLNSDGYVGVSNAVPEAALDVRGHTRLGNRRTSATDYSTELSSFGVISGANRYGSYGMLGFYATSGYTGGARTFAITNAYAATKFAILYGNNSTTVPSIGAGGSVVDGGLALAIDGSGNVGIGTSPSELLHINNASGDAAVRVQGNTRTFNIQQNNYGLRFVDVDAGSVERMRIDAAGIVTMPYQPCCYAYKSGNGNSTSGTGSAVLDIAGTNVGNHFSTSTGRFTCPIAGNYLINWYAMNSQGNTGTVTAILRVNGVGYSYFHIENSHPQSCSQQVVYSASAGDYFDLSINNFHFNGGSTFKYPGMSVVLIS
jgi:hypothetical protein